MIAFLVWGFLAVPVLLVLVLAVGAQRRLNETRRQVADAVRSAAARPRLYLVNWEWV